MSDNANTVAALLRDTANNLPANAYSFGVVAEFAGQLEKHDHITVGFHFYKQVGEAVERGQAAVLALAERAIVNAAGEVDFSAPVINTAAALDIAKDTLAAGHARLSAGDSASSVFMSTLRSLEHSPTGLCGALAGRLNVACRAGDLLSVELVINASGQIDFSPEGQLIVIETHGGMTLSAPVSHVTSISVDWSLVAEWDMKHGLIHNRAYFYRVSPEMVKAVRYVA